MIENYNVAHPCALFDKHKQNCYIKNLLAVSERIALQIQSKIWWLNFNADQKIRVKGLNGAGKTHALYSSPAFTVTFGNVTTYSIIPLPASLAYSLELHLFLLYVKYFDFSYFICGKNCNDITFRFVNSKYSHNDFKDLCSISLLLLNS
jgi:hypothetical protein